LKSALTIAGSDPTGGAGLQADLAVFARFGVRGLSAVAALTAQNTTGVYDVMPVPAAFLKEQIETLLDDIAPDALKTGMLWGRDSIKAVASIIERYGTRNLVVDPVSVSSSGRNLLEEGAVDVLRERLVPLAGVVTPNMQEASVLTSLDVKDISDMETAARRIRAMGPGAVIVTGGHLEGGAVDMFFDGSEVLLLRGEKMPGLFHGTGCAFSAAITARLAMGEAPAEAFRKAKDFMAEAIKKAAHPGRGMGLLGI
jgi:hydroxymethylpyrimidine/phosphomethylpyrimidine kinase